MAEGHIAELPRRTVVCVSGPEAEKFLNDLVTNDLTALAANGAGYGGLLAPQGKILFDFVVFRDAERFLFDLPKAVAADFIKRLGFYKLRAKVEISDLSTTHRIAAIWGSAGPPSILGIVAADPRLPALGYRVIVETNGPIEATGHVADGEAGYDAHRIALGIPEGGMDFTYGEAFPHDADMDQLGGVAFDKGCYIGQEVVSRMQHRGTARRRIVQASADAPLPQSGTEISAGGKPVGTITSSADNDGLALIRLDRAKEAIDTGVPLLANDVPVEIKIPDWAMFSWPNTLAQE
jgi:tRNA-modifying protein YgfZ